MADLVLQLASAACHGDVAGVTACLAAGADVNWPGPSGWTALAWAIHNGNPECVAALLAAGADPLALVDETRLVELAAYTRSALVPALLQAVPAQALAADGASLKMTLLSIVVNNNVRSLDCARYLLAQGALPAAVDVLTALSFADARTHPLIAILASRQPLTVWEWGQVPSPCDGLAAALPAVLQRSTAEAALLVRHLPAADRERLRTAALCLGRAQRLADAPLPTPILWHLLLQSVADSAAEMPAPVAAD